MMNLRQVLEAGAAVAYSIANPRVEDFVDIDEFGTMEPSKELTKNRYKWLDYKYPIQSSWIKQQKELINDQAAHANIITGDRTFRVVAGGKGLSTPFFDIEDEAFVRIDLWQISSVAIGLMHLFSGVTRDVAQICGRSVLGFRANFEQTLSGLTAESTLLLDEQKGSDSFKAAMLKREQREKAGQHSKE